MHIMGEKSISGFQKCTKINFVVCGLFEITLHFLVTNPQNFLPVSLQCGVNLCLISASVH